MKKILLLILITGVFVSCSTDIIYSQFAPIASSEWHEDSVVRFDYPIKDVSSGYQLIVYVRHTERYPYQNMWLFIGDSLKRDTIEFYLADDRGQWLGNNHNGFIEMPVLVEEHLHFSDTGMHSIAIQHGMRDSLLLGITDVGLEIRKNGEE